MPILSITTTANPQVFSGDGSQLYSIGFKNASTTGIIYLKNTATDSSTVTSSNADVTLNPGDAVSFSKLVDGDGFTGPFAAISDTAGGVNLNVIPVYKAGRLR